MYVSLSWAGSLNNLVLPTGTTHATAIANNTTSGLIGLPYIFCKFYRTYMSADIKMKIYKIKTSFVSFLGQQAQKNKIVIIFIFFFIGNLYLIRYYNDFSLWLRTGSNSADIYLFRIHTGIVIYIVFICNLNWKQGVSSKALGSLIKPI